MATIKCALALLLVLICATNTQAKYYGRDDYMKIPREPYPTYDDYGHDYGNDNTYEVYEIDFGNDYGNEYGNSKDYMKIPREPTYADYGRDYRVDNRYYDQIPDMDYYPEQYIIQDSLPEVYHYPESSWSAFNSWPSIEESLPSQDSWSAFELSPSVEEVWPSWSISIGSHDSEYHHKHRPGCKHKHHRKPHKDHDKKPKKPKHKKPKWPKHKPNKHNKKPCSKPHHKPHNRPHQRPHDNLHHNPHNNTDFGPHNNTDFRPHNNTSSRPSNYTTGHDIDRVCQVFERDLYRTCNRHACRTNIRCCLTFEAQLNTISCKCPPELGLSQCNATMQPSNRLTTTTTSAPLRVIVDSNDVTRAPIADVFIPTPAAATTEEVAPSLCESTNRILGGTRVTDDCLYPGVANVTITINGNTRSACNAVFTSAIVDNTRTQAFLTSQACTAIVTELTKADGGDANLPLLEISMGSVKLNAREDVINTIDGPDGSSFILVSSQTQNRLAGSNSCRATAACPFQNSDMAGLVDFDDCKAVSYGASSEETLATDGLREVAMKAYPVGCREYKSIFGATRPMCFRSTSGTPAYCSGDQGGPVYCRAPSSEEWILVGVLATNFECGLYPDIPVIQLPTREIPVVA